MRETMAEALQQIFTSGVDITVTLTEATTKIITAWNKSDAGQNVADALGVDPSLLNKIHPLPLLSLSSIDPAVLDLVDHTVTSSLNNTATAATGARAGAVPASSEPLNNIAQSVSAAVKQSAESIGRSLSFGGKKQKKVRQKSKKSRKYKKSKKSNKSKKSKRH
jgi:type IV secretory pathway VirB6-like protein